MKTAKKIPIDSPLLAGRDLTRRSLLRKGAALGALAATGPFFISSSLALSGVVKVFAWGDYIQPNIVEAFE